MADLLIAEELFLLLHDEESGKASGSVLVPDAAVAGALLLDLAEAETMRVDDKMVHTGPAPNHPLLAKAHAVLADSPKPKSVSHWLQKLPGRLKPIQATIGVSLVERGILAQERAKVLGLFPTTRWPELDPAPERQLRAGLIDVLVQGTTPTPHQALLVPLLVQLDLVRSIVDKDDRKAAKATAKEIAKAAKEGQLVSSAVSQTVAATRAAVLMLIMMSVITTSTI